MAKSKKFNSLSTRVKILLQGNNVGIENGELVENAKNPFTTEEGKEYTENLNNELKEYIDGFYERDKRNSINE